MVPATGHSGQPGYWIRIAVLLQLVGKLTICKEIGMRVGTLKIACSVLGLCWPNVSLNGKMNMRHEVIISLFAGVGGGVYVKVYSLVQRKKMLNQAPSKPSQNWISGAYLKLKKANVSFVMFVRPSAWDNSAHTARVFINFDILLFLKIGWENSSFIKIQQQ